MELLRDLPEFKETIENNLFLLSDIQNIVEDIDVEIDYSDDIISDIVDKIDKYCIPLEVNYIKVAEVIEDKRELAIAIFEAINEYECTINITNKKEIADDIIEKMSEFVKENYGISIKEAYLQTVGIL